jgi:hypothetical protein
LAVAAELLWGDRLLLPEEKERLAQGIAEYGKRFGLERRRFRRANVPQGH